MKGRILFLLLFLGIISYSSAQRFKSGVLAGVAATEISGDRLGGPNKAGIYAGTFVNLDISDKSSLQMEMNYILMCPQLAK